MRKWLQMEVAIHEQLRAAQSWRQVIFLPQVLTGTCKYCLAVGAVAAKLPRQSNDPLYVEARTILFPFRLQVARSFARQVFDENVVFLMCLVARGRRLEIEAHSAGFIILKSS